MRKLKLKKPSINKSSEINEKYEMDDNLKGLLKSKISMLSAKVLAAGPAIHIMHLKETSYSAYTALNDFYDQIPSIIDSVIKQYQGVTEELLDIPQVQIPSISTTTETIDYLRELYEMIDAIQSMCCYSEIKNTLNEIKSLINKTKYKLIFLK